MLEEKKNYVSSEPFGNRVY